MEPNPTLTNEKELHMSTFFLKLLAILSMTIDHFAAIIGQYGLTILFPSASKAVTSWAIQIMRAIGRLAFPLFAFQIAEGARKTRSMPRYIGRLALFAVISEPFFYFAFSVMPPSISGLLTNLSRLNLTNVFFTLSIGAIAIYGYQWIEKKAPERKLLLFLPFFLLCLFAAGCIGSDYSYNGVLLIVALYLAKSRKQQAAVILLWSLYLYILMQGIGNWNQVWTGPILNCLCAASVGLLIQRYNGKRGKSAKWFFYLYYPAHLLLLTILDALIKNA